MIEIIGITLSVAALAFTIWQGWLTRRHNRLSVRPYIVSRRNTNRTDDGVGTSFELLNVGLGPAVVKKFTVTLGDEVMGGHQMAAVEEAVTRALSGKINYSIRRSSQPGVGYCMKQHEEYMVAELFFPKLSRDGEVQVGKLIEPINIELEFESFYGEPDSFSTRSDEDKARRIASK